MTKPLAIAYDASTDIVTIEGVMWDAELLRLMSKEAPNGQWFRIISDSLGHRAFSTVSPELQKRFTFIAENSR